MPPVFALLFPRNTFSITLLLLPCRKTTAPSQAVKRLPRIIFAPDFIEIISASPLQLVKVLSAIRVLEFDSHCSARPTRIISPVLEARVF